MPFFDPINSFLQNILSFFPPLISLSVLSADHFFVRLLTSPEFLSPLEPKVSSLPLPIPSAYFFEFPFIALSIVDGLFLSPGSLDCLGHL